MLPGGGQVALHLSLQGVGAHQAWIVLICGEIESHPGLKLLDPCLIVSHCHRFSLQGCLFLINTESKVEVLEGLVLVLLQLDHVRMLGVWSSPVHGRGKTRSTLSERGGQGCGTAHSNVTQINGLFMTALCSRGVALIQWLVFIGSSFCWKSANFLTQFRKLSTFPSTNCILKNYIDNDKQHIGHSFYSVFRINL